jgi:hypothetical protein
MSFIKVHTKNYIIVHGFDKHNKEIEEYVEVETATEKLIAVRRIQSVSEKFILTTYAYNRYIYYEYEEDYNDIVHALKVNGLLVF